MLSNWIGATPALALTWKPVPGVPKTTPRGELTLKKFAGRLFGAERASGTPSQLISRRPEPNELWQRLLGRPASESGTLRHGDGTHGRSDRCRRSFVLPILQTLSTIISL